MVPQVEIKLPTYPAGRFKLRSIMSKDLVGVFTGEQFQEGVTIPLTAQYKVDIFEVRASKCTKRLQSSTAN